MAKRDDPASSGKRDARVTPQSIAAGTDNLAKGRAKKAKQREEAQQAGQKPAGERWAMLLDGRLSVRDLDDDEIKNMRPRGKDGGFGGSRRSVPSHLAQQFQQEAIRRANEKFRHAAPAAVARLLEIASDPDTKDGDAIRALSLVLERALGKVPDTIRVEGASAFDAITMEALGLDRDVVDPADSAT